MATLSMYLSNLTTPSKLSSLQSISGPDVQFLRMIRCPQLPITSLPDTPFKTTTIRMGGGPRTFPGGVSKWQWKRMQAKKAKQLLKARLARERQIYEMRKRAELKAAVSELERPWEVVEKAPNLFSVSADEQLKVLADRFQKPGGFDMWSELDGPELFKPGNALPSARYFPKGVVHSIKPYGKIENFDDGSDELDDRDADYDSGRSSEGTGDWKRGVEGPEIVNKSAKVRNEKFYGEKNNSSSSKFRDLPNEGNKVNGLKNKFRNNNDRRNSSGRTKSTEDGLFRRKNDRSNGQSGNANAIGSTRSNSKKKIEDLKSMAFDLTLQDDGSYELEP